MLVVRCIVHDMRVVSQSVDLGQNNNPNTTPTKDYEKGASGGLPPRCPERMC